LHKRALIVLFATALLAGGAGAWALRAHDGPSPDTNTPEITAMKTATTTPLISKLGHDITPLSPARIEQLAEKLSPADAKIILNKGTEPAFCGTLLDNKKDGTYICRLCSLPLFASNAKFDSGTGWPSFFQPVDAAHVSEHADNAYGMKRTEILCARCSAHLGHVFDDAPQTPTGRRHCLNSASLEFIEKGADFPAAALPISTSSTSAANTQTAYFAGGCFWGVEDRFQQLPGVIDAVSGYMGGKNKNPTYKQVCTGDTGHAETVKIVYDPSKISYPQLLEKFFRFHNPTQLNRQGPDYGTQYRSAIFATDDAQLAAATAFITAQQATDRYKTKKIVTQLAPVAAAGEFFAAEDYHQDYHVKNGGHCALPEE